jgi:hypothetical protein
MEMAEIRGIVWDKSLSMQRTLLDCIPDILRQSGKSYAASDENYVVQGTWESHVFDQRMFPVPVYESCKIVDGVLATFRQVLQADLGPTLSVILSVQLRGLLIAAVANAASRTYLSNQELEERIHDTTACMTEMQRLRDNFRDGCADEIATLLKEYGKPFPEPSALGGLRWGLFDWPLPPSEWIGFPFNDDWVMWKTMNSAEYDVHPERMGRSFFHVVMVDKPWLWGPRSMQVVTYHHDERSGRGFLVTRVLFDQSKYVRLPTEITIDEPELAAVPQLDFLDGPIPALAG